MHLLLGELLGLFGKFSQISAIEQQYRILSQAYKNHTGPVNLRITNRMWATKKYSRKIEQNYKTKIKQFYNADVAEFKSDSPDMNEVKDWAKNLSKTEIEGNLNL